MIEANSGAVATDDGRYLHALYTHPFPVMHVVQVQ